MKVLPTNQCSPHHRVITEKELEHFQFVFDKIKAWKTHVNDSSVRVGIMYDQNEIQFKEFWNNSVGKNLDKLLLYLSENWLIEDKDGVLRDINEYKKWCM